MRAAIFSRATRCSTHGKLRTIDSMLDEGQGHSADEGHDLYDGQHQRAYTIEPCGEFGQRNRCSPVAAVDLGIKSMTPHRMANAALPRSMWCRPPSSPSTSSEALNPDGVFLQRSGRPETGRSLK